MIESSSYCEVYFIRHGETEWNAQGRIQGHTDIPLNAMGTTQASSLGKLLADVHFSAAFSSDLSRARQTAELVLQPRALSLIESSALRERSAGQLEGQSSAILDQSIREFFLSEKALTKDTYLQTAWHPELETLQSVFQRVITFLTPHVEKHLGQSLLVVSHSGVLRSLLDHLDFTPLQRWVIKNCGFLKIKITAQSQGLYLLDYHGVSRRKMF